MKVEGVTFNVEHVKSIKKKDFISDCVNSVFLDREEGVRRKMLSDIYDRIKGTSNLVTDSDTVSESE